MSKWIAVLALAAALVFSSFAGAADKPAKAKGPHGKVSKVEKDSADATLTDITISVGKKGDTKDEVYKVDSKVTVTNGTEAATLADVVVGSNISLTLDGDKVTAIAIHTHKKKA